MDLSIKDRAAVSVPPPLMFLGCLGAGIGLEIFFSSHPEGLPMVYRIIAACLLTLIGGVLALGALLAMRRHHTPIDPAKATVRIVANGPFAFSRNPMYLSLLFVHGAVAALMGSVWLLLTWALLFLLLEFLAIRPEEKYLKQKFGDEYLTYMKKVRRWL